MQKKAILLVFLVLALVTGACGININIDAERGSGSVVTETREVTGFDRVVLSGIGDVTLVQGDEITLEIEAEDNVIRNITTEVRDGTLFIGYNQRAVFPTRTVKFYLTMPEVRGLDTRGVSNIQAEDLSTDQLDIGISGTGNIVIENLQADQLAVNVSGAGNFSSVGQAGQQRINLSGAGNYNGEDLRSESADVTISGLGKVSVWATDALTIVISGAGSVDYYGNPQVNQQINGLGRIQHQGDK
jgi:hypothetical protein